ncbi:Low-density lipoprotein receptor-related protein 2 [Halotydeus destructor]|nr:Low-density lipoprotein receptor-related protein 2 [Halotydeus destructor]
MCSDEATVLEWPAVQTFNHLSYAQWSQASANYHQALGLSQCPKGTFECAQPNVLGIALTPLQQPWRANGSKCIPVEKVCDRIKDCPYRDDEDEQRCACLDESDNFRCKGIKSKCIPLSWTCDKVRDCPHGDDELDSNCVPQPVHSCLLANGPYYSPSYMRKAIPVSWKCDGELDCSKGDDEKFCPTAYPKAKCSEGQYNCLKSSTCIDKSLLCNRIADCPQEDDESDCKSTLTLPDSGNITLNTVPTKA